VGAPAARFTAEDFLIPPEFRGLRLAPLSAGQIGGVRLELVERGGKTRLGACYQQVPVQVLPPFQLAGDPAALLYLLNPTAGLMDGDGHRLDITARAGSRAVVTGQSATRIHPAVKSFCTQQWHIRVEAGAELVVLPGPAIPFRNCRYFQQGIIELAAGARLIWGDIWLPGRYARDDLAERFQFDRLVQHLEVRREGELIYRDRFAWAGPWDEAAAQWHLGGHLATAALFVTGPVALASRTEADGPQRAVLSLESGDSVVRWCGSPTGVTAELVTAALQQAARWSGGPSAAPWLLGARNLAPNHWFSIGFG